MKNVLRIAAYVAIALAVIGLVSYGYHNIQYGANARLRAARARDAATLAALPQQRAQIEKNRQASIKQAKSLWGGPQWVNVVKKGAITKVDSIYYTTAELEVVGAKPPLTVQRLVPTELTDSSPFKLWWCAKSTPECNPAVGYSTAIDDPRRPYAASVATINAEHDQQLAGLPTKASLDRAYTRSDALDDSKDHNWFFMYPLYILAIITVVVIAIGGFILIMTTLDNGW